MRTLFQKKDHAVSLPCGVDLPVDNNYSLEWRKNNKLILSAFGTEPGHSAPQYQGRIARDGSTGLTIHAVETTDAGVFHCVITKFEKQPTRPEHGSSIRLVINVSPQIISPQNDVTEYAKVGDTINVECKVEGSPPPDVSWTKNSRVVSSSPVLHIANMTNTAQGKYICVAANAEGRAESTLQVLISNSLTFDLLPSNKTVSAGTNVFWHCHTNAQPSTIQYDWMLENRPIKKTPTGLRVDLQKGDLSLREVRKVDRGWYTCEATNSRGDSNRASAFLDVQYAPEALPSHRQVVTIGVGHDGILKCEVDANPAVQNYSWTKNGIFITTTQQNSFTVKNAMDADGGIYSCQATNSIGRGEILESHVIVAEPPTFVVTPPPEVRVREGGSVEVPCEGFGDPLPIVYWLHNQSRISSSSLSIPEVSSSDHGEYECTISNAVATISTKMSLIVEKSRPQPAVISNIQCRGTDELIVNWSAGFDGSHAQTFIVHYKANDGVSGSITTSNTSAVLEYLLPFSVYDITVESRNIKGSSNSTTQQKAVCSTLDSPDDLVIDGTTVQWSPVEHAETYRVETRNSKKHVFRETGEVVNPSYRFPELSNDNFMEVRVYSMKPHFRPSAPSRSVQFGLSDSDNTTAFAIGGGLIFLLMLFSLYLFCNSKSRFCFRKQRKLANDYVCPTNSSQPRTETYFEPSINLWTLALDGSNNSESSLRMDDGEYGEWSGHNSVRLPYPHDLLEFDHEICGDQTAIEDMLRFKYIYGVEDVPPQLLTDLRIERLRREFKQSHI